MGFTKVVLWGQNVHPDEGPLRLLGLHPFAELVVAPEPDGPRVGASIDPVRRGGVQPVVDGVLKPEPASVGTDSKQQLPSIIMF